MDQYGYSMELKDRGTSIGSRVWLNRNNNATTPAAGHIVMLDKGGDGYRVWPDDSGNLRIVANTDPTNANDAVGTIVGTQTSNLAFKTITHTPSVVEGYNAVREAATAVRDFYYTDHRHLNRELNGPKIQRGIVVNYAPQFGYDYHPDYPDGKALDVVTSIGNLCLATSYLGDRIETQDQKIARLEQRIAHLETRLTERN
jgi:hypothetical protein